MRCHRQLLWPFLDNCKVVERRGRVFPKDSMSRFPPLSVSILLLLLLGLVRLQDRPLSSDLFRRRGVGAAAIVDGTEERAASRSECAKSPLTYL